MRSQSTTRGDTIVEVMLAIAALSAILAISWGIVTKSVQISTAARQRVTMVNQLKEQAEVLKSLYADSNGRSTVLNRTFGGGVQVSSVTQSSIPAFPCVSTRSSTNVVNTQTPSGAFYLRIGESGIAPEVASTKEVASAGNARVWIQLIDTSGSVAGDPGFIDFYIRGCWQTAGSQNEDATQLVVRLNK